jgi:hypothetical protein
MHWCLWVEELNVREKGDDRTELRNIEHSLHPKQHLQAEPLEPPQTV